MKILRLCFFALLSLGTSVGVCAQCPPGVPTGTNCVAGVDAHGAFYLIAVPANYNGRLVLWEHGYTLTPPAPLGAADLGVGLLSLTQGFAAAASSFRPDAVGLSGWQVRDCAVPWPAATRTGAEGSTFAPCISITAETCRGRTSSNILCIWDWRPTTC
jgi:hypothetical protein